MGSAKYCDGVEDGRGAAALRSRKPGGDNAAVAGKDGRLEQAGEHAENEDGGERGAGGEVAGEGGEKGAHRPADDGDAVDALGSEAVEQAARGQLPQRIGPPEGEEQIAHALRSQVQLFGHDRDGLRKHRAVSKAEAADDKENGDDEIANVRLPLLRSSRILSVQCFGFTVPCRAASQAVS